MKSMQRTTNSTLMLLAITLAASPGAFAGDIFNGTGQDLYNDAKASFPTWNPDVVGTSLEFRHSGYLVVWARYPVFPGGTFNPVCPDLEITTEIEHSIQSGDDDFRIGITDGFNVIDVAYANNNAAGVVGAETHSTISGVQLILSDFLQFFANGPTEAKLTAIFNLSNTASAVSASLPGGFSGSASGGSMFDCSQALDFLLISGNNDDILLDTLRISSPQSEPLDVAIDIKPGSDPNSINLCSNGTVPVAIFGSETFNVDFVDPDTLRLAEATVKVVGRKDPHSLCSKEFVDDDFHYDLVCHFLTTDIAGTDGESSTARVNGELFSGFRFEGSDSVNIVKDSCGPIETG